MKYEIISIILIIAIYNFILTSGYFDEDTLKVKLIPLSLFGMFAFFIFVLSILSIFYYRTTRYVNYLKDVDPSDDKFQYIKKIKLSIPDDYIDPLLNIATTQGIRIEIPQKRQKCISLKRLKELFPKIVDWYVSLPPLISKIIGSKVKITPLTESNSLCLVAYEKKGDYIDWHFDTNHYNGRYFTLLIPVTTKQTCGNYQYRNKDSKIQTVRFGKEDALLFEGDKVYHRAKELCANQFRVVLSCTFTTSQNIPMIEYLFQTIKNLGIFGEL
jgi:hypothetical protein